jgi:hypothetical protein
VLRSIYRGSGILHPILKLELVKKTLNLLYITGKLHKICSYSLTFFHIFSVLWIRILILFGFISYPDSLGPVIRYLGRQKCIFPEILRISFMKNLMFSQSLPGIERFYCCEELNVLSGGSRTPGPG